MKKITKLISLLCLAAAFVLASCSSSTSGGGITYIGSKAPTEPKDVGDIVFNDGSATPYAKINERTITPKITTEEKAAAIAVIFYVGTGLNSDDANGDSDNTTVRTLGVGLKHDKTGLAWCRWNSRTDYANGFSKIITTITCTIDSGDKNGSDNLEQIGNFLGTANNDTTTLSNYPAFQFGKEYSTAATKGTDYDKSGWYLPSLAELYAIYNVKTTVDAASSLCGGSRFAYDWYWSSSQYASLDVDAYGLYFSNGYRDGLDKNNDEIYVCAVRAFN